MEWEPDERDAWVKDAERWIQQIPSAMQCKIDLDQAGEITAVHVVADAAREARHIVRDVEGLLKARLGIDIYYKKIGVVQVVDDGLDEGRASPATEAGTSGLAAAEEPAPLKPVDAVLLEEYLAPRILCSGVGLVASEASVRAEVELQAGPLEARGFEEGPNHTDSDIQLIGRATVHAVRELMEDEVVLNLTEIRLDRMAGQTVILAGVELVEGRRSECLFGTCPTFNNRQQAVVFAILDALNRRVAFMPFKTGDVAN